MDVCSHLVLFIHTFSFEVPYLCMYLLILNMLGQHILCATNMIPILRYWLLFFKTYQIPSCINDKKKEKKMEDHSIFNQKKTELLILIMNYYFQQHLKAAYPISSSSIQFAFFLIVYLNSSHPQRQSECRDRSWRQELQLWPSSVGPGLRTQASKIISCGAPS